MAGPGGSDDLDTDGARPLVVLSNPTPDDIAALEDQLYGFNVAATGIDDGRYLSIFLKRDDGTIYAGLHGHSWAGVCEIKTLWIADSERGKGLGSRLLAEAEQEARRRGCHVIHLASFTFQAPDFYEKHGFQRLVQLEDFPRGHANVLLAKTLAPEAPV
ncbi:GNAT family N-acetyltransferase [Mesorhizobium loti]|uniref:GNAT family N-acetyltransferase n=1 Tax=Rhizobium loti TaxID=381 RepID=UPI000402DE97|nr:GNAT family N-acetyltransferase [Mesorhizobium loti]